jgi:predicted RNA methylase
MVDLSGITKNSIVYDLGSGDGKLLFLAKKKGGKKIIGVEINPLLVLFTKLKIIFLRKRNIDVVWGNFWSTSIRNADVGKWKSWQKN